MALTDLQKRTAQAIVNIFETGRVRGHYNAVTVLQGDSGHLSYGRSQATLGSGTLYILLKQYCDAPGALCQPRFLPLLPRFRDKDLTLDQDRGVHDLLREAGNDPVMRRVQDDFFDRVYWQRACRSAETCRLALPLSTTVVYDGFIHGSFGRIRNRVNAAGPPPDPFDEKLWVKNYVDERRRWLLSGRPPLPVTVYRMDAFTQLMADGKWDLPLPLRVRGVLIEEAALTGADEPFVPARAPDDAPLERILQLARPYQRGDDVKALQQALSRRGFPNSEDGIFGPLTEVLVRQYQRSKGLRPDGIVGPITWADLLADQD